MACRDGASCGQPAYSVACPRSLHAVRLCIPTEGDPIRPRASQRCGGLCTRPVRPVEQSIRRIHVWKVVHGAPTCCCPTLLARHQAVPAYPNGHSHRPSSMLQFPQRVHLSWQVLLIGTNQCSGSDGTDAAPAACCSSSFEAPATNSWRLRRASRRKSPKLADTELQGVLPMAATTTKSRTRRHRHATPRTHSSMLSHVRRSQLQMMRGPCCHLDAGTKHRAAPFQVDCLRLGCGTQTAQADGSTYKLRVRTDYSSRALGFGVLGLRGGGVIRAEEG